MGIDADDDDKIYDEVWTLVYHSNPHIIMDPDTNFNFRSLNQAKIGNLLVNGLNQQECQTNEVSSLAIFDIFTNIIIEALQQLDLIPKQHEEDIEQLQYTFRLCTEMKEHYDKL